MAATAPSSSTASPPPTTRCCCSSTLTTCFPGICHRPRRLPKRPDGLNHATSKTTSFDMRLNPFKNIRLSVQLFALVAISFLIASGLIYYAMRLVQSTQVTLKHTIDNRMVSGQSIQGVADALSLALENSLNVIEKKQTPQEAHDQIKEAVGKAKDDWDSYFLGEMIEEEQALADETTPLLDSAYGKIDRLLKKLESGDIADLAAWRN